MNQNRKTIWIFSIHYLPSGLSYWASGGLKSGVTGGQAGMPIHYVGLKLGVLNIFFEYSLKLPQICSNMLEYTRYFLVGRVQRSTGRGGRSRWVGG
jgi:hypothetical protein